MKVAPITKIKSQFDDYIKACQNEPVVLTERGQIVAVLLSVSDEEQLEQLVLTHSSEFQRILDSGKQQIKEGKVLSHEDFWNQMETEQ